MHSFERTPDGAFYDLPENWSCSCGCGEIVKEEDFVRVNGKEFYVSGHETSKSKQEAQDNTRKAESDFSTEWPTPDQV